MYICEKKFKYDESDYIKFDKNYEPENKNGALYYSDGPDDKIGKYKKVRDHCHLRGKYRGAAHNICNINLKLPKNIPVFRHNMSGYDTHLYIKQLAKIYKKVDLNANIDEIYINYSIYSGYGYSLMKTEDEKIYETIVCRYF